MANNNTSTNNTNVANNKEANTMNNNTSTIFTADNARMAGAAPAVWAGDILAAGAEMCRKAAEFIGGGQEKRVVGYNYLAARTTGSLTKSAKAAMTAAAKATMEEKSPLTHHSPNVDWDKWHWVPSATYVQAQKKAGKEAFLPSLYKAANGLINFAKYGKGDLTTQYKGVSYARMIEKAIYGHATWLLEKKGLKNVFDRLEAFYKEACWLSMVDSSKLPTWEDIKAATSKEDAAEDLAAEIAADEPAETEPKAETKKEEEEAREGRAPETEPEESVRKYNDLLKVIGVKAVRANNAKGVAEKAAAAFEAGKINASEKKLFIEKAASKFPEGSQEAAQILALC